MISLFSANTRNLGWKRFFNSSYIIKLFTWWEIRPEVREFFGLKDIHDCPTHGWNDGEKGTVSGRTYIFESRKTNQQGWKYYPCRTFAFQCGGDFSLFEAVVRSAENKVYAIWLWFNFFRRAMWWWIFKRNVIYSKQWFGWLYVCSKITFKLIKYHCESYELPNLTKAIKGLNENVISPAYHYNIIYDSKGELYET